MKGYFELTRTHTYSLLFALPLLLLYEVGALYTSQVAGSNLRNGADVAISAVARCAPADRYFDVVEAYFKAQSEWLHEQDLRQAIFDQATAFDFTEETFNACLGNQSLLQALDSGMQRAQSFVVTGTPTFFVNGEKHVGALPMDQWDAIIGPKLAEAGE